MIFGIGVASGGRQDIRSILQEIVVIFWHVGAEMVVLMNYRSIADVLRSWVWQRGVVCRWVLLLDPDDSAVSRNDTWGGLYNLFLFTPSSLVD